MSEKRDTIERVVVRDASDGEIRIGDLVYLPCGVVGINVVGHAEGSATVTLQPLDVDADLTIELLNQDIVVERSA